MSKKRMRGVLLTTQGLYKLQDAKQLIEHNEDQNFTFECLSLQTGLDTHTLCKIFNRTAGVDKRSLARCFQAFNLMLEPDDYNLSTVSSPNLNSGTIKVLAVDNILDSIERLSLDDQKTVLDIIQFRFGGN